MRRSSYFGRVGVSTVKSRLDAVLGAEMVEPEALRALAREELPKNYRARVWAHLLLGWKSSASVTFLTQQVHAKYADLRRVMLVLSDEGKKKPRRPSPETRVTEMMAMLRVQSRLMTSLHMEATPEELEAMLSVFVGVFEDNALAYYCFQRKLLRTKAEANALCARTLDMLHSRGQQEVVELVDGKMLRTWFRSLFAVAFRDQVVTLWDVLFSMETEDAFNSFLCATAVAIIKLNVRPDATEFKLTAPVGQVIKLAVTIHENKKQSSN